MPLKTWHPALNTWPAQNGLLWPPAMDRRAKHLPWVILPHWTSQTGHIQTSVYSDSFPDLPKYSQNHPCFEAALDILRHKIQEQIESRTGTQTSWLQILALLLISHGILQAIEWLTLPVFLWGGIISYHMDLLRGLDNSYGMSSTVCRKHSLWKALFIGRLALWASVEGLNIAIR